MAGDLIHHPRFEAGIQDTMVFFGPESFSHSPRHWCGTEHGNDCMQFAAGIAYTLHTHGCGSARYWGACVPLYPWVKSWGNIIDLFADPASPSWRLFSIRGAGSPAERHAMSGATALSQLCDR